MRARQAAPPFASKPPAAMMLLRAQKTYRVPERQAQRLTCATCRMAALPPSTGGAAAQQEALASPGGKVPMLTAPRPSPCTPSRNSDSD